MSTATVAPDVARPRLESERLRDLIVVGLPCVVAAVLAFYELGSRSLWIDEGATVAISAQHGAALWHAIAHDGGNMLGYYLLAHVLTGLFGHAPALVRVPSALAMVATVALVGVIALRVFDRRAALASGLLCAVSLPLVFWGQDARGYALMTMAIAGSFLGLIMLINRASRWAWPVYVIATVFAVYMSFVAVLVVPAQLAALAWRRERARPVFRAGAVVAICCVPILVLALERGSSQLFWVPPLSAGRIGEMLRWLTSAGMPPNFHRTATGTITLIVSLVALGGVGAAILALGRRTPWGVVLASCWLLVPVLLILIESAVGQPVALARNSLVSLPAVSLLLGWGLTRGATPPTLAALAVLLALRALQLAPSYGASPENWKAATSHVVAASRAGDCIAFYPADGRMAFQYYLPARGRLLAPVLPRDPWTPERAYVERYATLSAAQLTRTVAACRRLWLVSSHEGFANGPSASRTNYARYEALVAALTRAYPARTTTSYGWASPVRVELFAR